jgi:hypothetical protein
VVLLAKNPPPMACPMACIFQGVCGVCYPGEKL